MYTVHCLVQITADHSVYGIYTKPYSLYFFSPSVCVRTVKKGLMPHYNLSKYANLRQYAENLNVLFVFYNVRTIFQVQGTLQSSLKIPHTVYVFVHCPIYKTIIRSVNTT
jgi:hypothetical protein